MHVLQTPKFQRGLASHHELECPLRQQAHTQPLARKTLQLRASPITQRATLCVAAAAAATDEATVSEVGVPVGGGWRRGPAGVARLRGVRGSPFKYRRVMDQIRYHKYDYALKILDDLPHRACETIREVLVSAKSNATHNFGADQEHLYITECFVDDAGMYKRFQPRSKGRPFPIQVKKSHMTIKVEEYVQGKRMEPAAEEKE